ncbi:MAG: NAD(P)/FAD-dependent oxidoreductase [Sciscionella sp.]
MHTVTVVGASLAGLSAARALREQGYEGRILVVGDEWHHPYDRPPLSKEFLAATVSSADLALRTPDDDALDVRWMLGRSAVQLDTSGTAVVLDSGQRLVSDGVVIATGARPRKLPGPRMRGVHTLRTVEDAVALRSALSPGARLVVIGAGFIGAEVAATASALGVEVTIVEALSAPLAGPLGTDMGAVCASLHAEHGVKLITSAGNARLAGAGRVTAVRFGDGRELPADVVVVGIGAVPATDWLAYSGLTVDGGVLTDSRCATTIPGVVAVGDCAISRHPGTGELRRVEHWTNALQRPTVAVATLLGRDYQPPVSARVPYFWSDQYGVRIQFAGYYRPGDHVEVVDGDTTARRFVAVYRRAGTPSAVLAMNDSKPFNRWRRELATQAGAATLTPRP